MSIAIVTIALCGTPAGAFGLSEQAITALRFLRLLESRNIEAAHAMLSPRVARVYVAGKLAASSTRGVRAATSRQVRFEGPIAPERAYANRLARYLAPGASAYIVCLADVPKSGFGSVSYALVILVPDAAKTGWQVSEYRYQSELDPACGKKKS